MGEEGKKEEEEEGYLIQRHKNSPFALPPLSEGKERDRPSRPRFTTGAPPSLSFSLLASRLSSRPILLLVGLGAHFGSQSDGRGQSRSRANGDDSSIKM